MVATADGRSYKIESQNESSGIEIRITSEGAVIDSKEFDDEEANEGDK